MGNDFLFDRVYKVSPCYKCPNHCVGCHGKCEAYKEYNELNKLRRKNKYEAKEKERDFYNFKQDSVDRTIRSSHPYRAC